jgi:G3E family GTPase
VKIDARLPVILLTGHLGSGKTTLLNAYLRDAGEPVAVVINEFGDVGLDHLLVRETQENLTLLENGCICCTVRSDLIATLRDLLARRDAGHVPPFRRVVIETTGLADPAPVVHSLMNDLALVMRYRLERVATTVAAIPGCATLDAFPEARKQVAFADAVAVTKADLADAAALAALEARLRSLNPAARLMRLGDGADAASLIEGGGFDPAVKGSDVEAWLNAEAVAHDHRPGEACLLCATEAPRHGDMIRSFCITRDRPIGWEAAAAWLEGLAADHGPNLLRVKGMLNIAGRPEGPVVVHGVQHLFHPPELREGWPGEDRRSRTVFITRGIRPDIVEAALQAAEAAEAILQAAEAAAVPAWRDSQPSG